jgi:hypothetical protein
MADDQNTEQKGLQVTGFEEETPTTAPVNQQGDLLALAINQNVDTDKLQALIDMKNAEEARRNKQEFDRHFAEMQAEFESAHRTKQGYDYRYAPIEELQKQYGPIIARHGFSYRWREEALDNGSKRVILRISGYGHAEENFFDVPQIEGTKQMNPIQVAGAMSTYGRRYTFISGFGIIIDDEDNDAQELSFEDGYEYAEYIEQIRAEETVDSARTVARNHYRQLKDSGDQKGAQVVMQAFNRYKAELEAE